MLKKIYWLVVGLIVMSALGTMVYYGMQPRAIRKINISQFEDNSVLARSLLLRFREEIKNSPLLFFGIDPQNQDDWKVLDTFLRENQEAGFHYDYVAMDDLLNPPAGFPEFEKIQTKENIEQFWLGISQALRTQKRVVVIVPYIYSTQMVPGNVVNKIREKILAFNKENENQKSDSKTNLDLTQTSKLTLPTSFSMAKLPRTRPEEKEMAFPCVVEAIDQSGVGPFGCQITQVARTSYRKRFPIGSHVGLASQVGLRDYLILHAIEK